MVGGQLRNLGGGEDIVVDGHLINGAIERIEKELICLHIISRFANQEVTRRRIERALCIRGSHRLTVLIEGDRTGCTIYRRTEVYPLLLREQSCRRKGFLLPVDITCKTILPLRIKEESKAFLIRIIEARDDCSLLVARYIQYHHRIGLTDAPEGDGHFLSVHLVVRHRNLHIRRISVHTDSFSYHAVHIVCMFTADGKGFVFHRLFDITIFIHLHRERENGVSSR